MVGRLRVLLLSLACSAALSAQAQGAAVNIPAGDLVTALDALARQSGVQFVYSADQLKGLRTQGVHGAMAPADALDRLLRGSGYAARRDASGAMVIVKSAAPAAPPPRPRNTPRTPDGAAADMPAMTELESIQVTGSRIPRAQIEGPAPVTVMTAQEIKANGFTTVPDVLRAMTQNGGETQSQQSASGADFSPGAQQVDLRGLGPNHTLVLVNGRRIADFPMPFKGRSNFTDISNIPLGMVDRIEILTGSASAIYGSDAISGVVNFILKKQADGTTVDMRMGDTTRGGGESFNLSVSSGYSNDRFSAIYGFELQSQNPLWAYERARQDSTRDAPSDSARAARRAFLRTNWDDEYLDPGAACDGLARLNGGTTHRASRPGWGADGEDGFYCGSEEAIGYGTMISEREGVNAYASLSYRFDNDTEWFADLQLGYHKLSMFRDVGNWSYQAPDGNEQGYFFNQATDQVEYWQRQFSPEEMGGLSAGTIRNRQKTFSLTTGFKGRWGEHWDWETALSHSQYQSTISWPQIVASKANDLFLGPQLGTDDDGFPIFNADPERLYRPLTRAEYDSIAARTTYQPKSRTDALSLTFTNTELFTLPAGAAGFAGTLEVGSQSYNLRPDPLATQYYYYSWRDADGHGSRDRWAAAGELRLPLLDSLNFSVAGRYDQYRYSGHSIDKFTYSAGLEWRPVESLLLRGSYGTAFRAPDLHYLYAGEGNSESSGVDYYRCRSEEPGTQFSDCSFSDENVVVTRRGNRKLDPETSTAWTAGLVWSPLANLDFSLDYFNIDLRDQVQDLRIDGILQDEASCRLGQRPDGSAVDANSPTCIDALARVGRSDDGSLYSAFVNPINIARERTNGVDFNARYRLETAIGTFRFNGNYSWVREHESQQYAGDRVEDQFAVNSGFDIPRSKASASVSWDKNRWTATLHGERLGKLPNYDSYQESYDPADGGSPWIGATYRYNLSLQYRFTDHAQLALSVTNLFDKLPPKDASYSSYPYYDVSWFDTVGRQVFVQYTHKFGGSAL
ncbi:MULTISPECIES: TonB-dependent receptor [unclassified Lysobacter]|uniref:TonB-dependent receptor n=1 Tax=unclassified Lysobacter TaxID=2635362 RepID=UPI001BE6217F|nr:MULTISPECIES: TonB-dependent receptor [unclassified Lysobacter]MBT2745798.1 TonB-dependent receptor [Lysobacter sp. ISL-42]MBT2749643.1 TonB-dependent receptor [Lysobacter sp. ISL-50]MBT2777638.1 TonB-dependent receptor [Lysobacter sp. ISL-54]MBT2782126.1 TonB-dependent receptor [Lysobacter sp. ISL-52]